MYPILFPSDNITTRLGMGKMIETISCEVYEELNGEFSLEFQYPITGELYADLLNGGTVQVISPTYVSTNIDRQGMQWFDIYKHSLPINGVVTFYAQHVSRRLSQGVFVGTSAGGSTLAYIWGAACKPSSPFNGVTFAAASGTNPGTGNTFTVSEPKSPLGVLLGAEESFISNFGGEVGFKCDFSVGNPRCTVYYVTQRGGDYGAEVRHGYNLTDLQRDKDASECYNAVVPYWDDGNGNKTYTLNYVVQPTTPITPVVAVPLDATDAFPTQPTDAQLTTFAQNHLDNYTPWVIPETLTVDFINGVEIDPHAAPIGIGDIVHVYWADGSVDAKMRVISYKYDVLAERYAELKLGSPQREFVAVTGDTPSGNTYSGTGGGGLPAGGNAGDALIKNSSADGDVIWSNLRVLLWTNPNMGSAFTPQNVGIITQDYQFLLIEFSVAGSPTAVIAVIGVQGAISAAQYATAYSNRLREFSRDFTVNPAYVNFDNAYATTEGSNTAINNALLVPYRIWGLRI